MSGHDTMMLAQLNKARVEAEEAWNKVYAAKEKLSADFERCKKELADQKASDLATIEANVDTYLSECVIAKEAAEQARVQLADDIKEFRKGTKNTLSLMKVEMLAYKDSIIKGATSDKKWATAIIEEGHDRIMSQLDALIADHESLGGWIEAKGVDEIEVRKVIEKDLKTLEDARQTADKEKVRM